MYKKQGKFRSLIYEPDELPDFLFDDISGFLEFWVEMEISFSGYDIGNIPDDDWFVNFGQVFLKRGTYEDNKIRFFKHFF